ncbi:MAG: hypothetical protein KGJ60_14775 [Verrucomicrobiota bacterium]|nr:hypothetical protein [Verrucomicrobiota bacterium]
MKTTTLAVLTALGLALPLRAAAQANATTTNASAETTVVVPSNTPVATPPANPANPPAEAVAAGETNTPSEAAAGGTNAPAEAVASGGTNAAPAAAGQANEAEAVALNTNAPVIPLIQFQDVPITSAIESLARQAGINYLLDPSIGYNQPGPNGQIKREPTLSIRWENVSAQEALLALLDNYGLQLVQDPKTTIARITIRNPNAPPPLVTKVIQLKYASVSNMTSVIDTMFTDRRSKVVSDSRTSQLVVVATEGELASIDDMIAQLDTPTKQVLIEARLFETSMNPSTSKGVDWFSTFANQHVSYGNGTLNAASSSTTTLIPGASTSSTLPGGRSVTTQPGSSSSTLLNTIPGGGLSLNTVSGLTPNIGFLSADGLSAVLSFFNQNSQARILAEPRTVTLDNQMAHIAVGQEYPIINVTAGTANTTGGSQVNYSNLTVSLDVTPRISANNYINLRVAPHVMRLDSVQKFTVGTAANGSPNTFDVPIFDTRDIATTVMIPSGDTLVMGGLLEDDTHLESTKVPLLGDVPGLGMLFRSNSKTRTKNNLLVFITPTIIQASDYQPTTTDFLQTPPPKEAQPDWSSWDSTKPYQWEKSGAAKSNNGWLYNSTTPPTPPPAAATPGAPNLGVPPPSSPPAATVNAVQQFESTGTLPPDAKTATGTAEPATNAVPNP